MKKPRYRIIFWNHSERPNFIPINQLGTWVPFGGKWIIIREVV
jgi:ribosomal protein S16